MPCIDSGCRDLLRRRRQHSRAVECAGNRSDLGAADLKTLHELTCILDRVLALLCCTHLLCVKPCWALELLAGLLHPAQPQSSLLSAVGRPAA